MKTGLALVIIGFGLAVQAQPWTNRYDGIAHGNDYIAGVAVDKSGNVFVAGSSQGADSFVPDFVLIKYSNSGNQLWVNRYTKYNKEITTPGKISVDPEGNVLIVGTSTWDVLPDGWLEVMKVSGTGQKLWTNTILGQAYQGVPRNLVLGPHGELANTRDTNLVMYSAGGAALATNAYDYWGTINDQVIPPSMTYDDNGNLAVSVFDDVGWTTVKYSSDGQRAWMRKYLSADEYAFPSVVAADHEGNLIVTGAVTADPYAGSTDLVTIKYSASGSPMWTNRNALAGGALAIDKDGNVLVGGLPGVAKYSPSGAMLWMKQQPGFTNSNYYYPNEIRIDSGQNLIVSAASFGNNSSNPEMVILKYSSSGSLLWTNRRTLAGSPFSEPGAESLAVDANENVILGVTSDPGPNSYDILTIKYVTPPALSITRIPNAVVLNWANPAFSLQVAHSASGPFANLSTATSPYTNPISGPQLYFRLGQ